MAPKPSQPQSGELFRPRLDEQINMKHPLVRLAALIDWTEIEGPSRLLSRLMGGGPPWGRVWLPGCCACSTPSMPLMKPW